MLSFAIEAVYNLKTEMFGKNHPYRRFELDSNTIAEIIKTCAIFDGLPEETYLKIASMSLYQEYSLGTVIIEENEQPRETLFVIEKGELVVSTGEVGPDGHNIVSESMLTTLGAGDVFGEIALIDDMPHSANVKAMSDAAIVMIPSKKLREIIDSDARAGMAIYKNLAKLLCERLRLSNLCTKHFN